MNDEQLHNVYLGLGSNLGDKEKNIKFALENIDKRIGRVTACSAFLITEPVGFDSKNLFVNAVCLVNTYLKPLEVLEYTQVIEREMGRRSKSYNEIYTDREIDIDILLYDEEIQEYPHLILPHPHLHERSFVLLPFNEIAGNAYHPVLNKTIRQLLDDLIN